MESLAAQCISVLNNESSLFVVLFLGGLTGGMTHCIWHCGSLTACHLLCGNSSKNTQSYFSWHVGRFLAYGALGFCAALLGRHIMAFAYWPIVASTMLILAGGIFIAGSLFSRFRKPLRRVGFAHGIFMGFMPCSLLYAALMVVTVTANPWQGLIGMWLFTLGTMPALLLANGGAGFIAKKWKTEAVIVGRLMMAINGFSLWILAENLVKARG